MATSSSLRGRVTEIATCSVCLEVFAEPKSLPCVHSFCLQCLEQHCKDKLPGDEVSCPLCRKEFTIPDSGLSELPHNFFIQSLIDAKETTNDRPRACEIMCEACSADDSTGEKATVYCVDCSQKLCEHCSLSHNRMRGGPHQIQQMGAVLKQESSRGIFCEKHKDKLIESYCFDCKRSICVRCLYTDHKKHSSAETDVVAEKFLKQIDDDMLALLEKIGDMKQMEEQLNTENDTIIDAVNKIESAVKQKGESIKKIVDRQVNELLQKLQSFESVSMKKVEISRESIELSLLAMESFNNYCEELKKKGRPSDITRVANDLHARASELLQTSTVPEDFRAEQISFVPRSLGSGHLLVGRLVTNSDSDNSMQTYEPRIKRALRNVLSLFAPAITPTLRGQMQSRIGKKEAATMTEHEAGVNDGQVISPHFQETVDKTMPDPNQLPPQTQSPIGMKESAAEREAGVNDTQVISPRARRSFSGSAVPIGQLQTDKIVKGVTMLNMKLFAVCYESDTVHGFGEKFERLEDIKVKGLKEPQDIVACSETNSLYVADSDCPGCVWQLSKDGRVRQFLPRGTCIPNSLSVTIGRLLVTTNDALLLYNSEGLELKRLSFSFMSGLQHAVETSRGSFVFSHLKPQPQVVRVDGDGQIMSIFDDQQELCFPCHLSFGFEGRISVMDYFKRHVLLLTSDLQLERKLLDSEHNQLVDKPFRLSYIVGMRQLMVAGGSSDGVIQVFSFPFH